MPRTARDMSARRAAKWPLRAAVLSGCGLLSHPRPGGAPTPAFSARARPLVTAPRFVPGAAEGGGSEGGGPGPGSGRFLRSFRPGGTAGASAWSAAPSRESAGGRLAFPVGRPRRGLPGHRCAGAGTDLLFRAQPSPCQEFNLRYSYPQLKKPTLMCIRGLTHSGFGSRRCFNILCLPREEPLAWRLSLT